MAKHYLLTRKSKGLSIKKIARMSDEEAYNLFKEIRWSENNGNPVCPKCGNTEKSYFIPSRKQYRCGYKGCRHTYSITSGTLFHSRKLDLQTYLIALLVFAQAKKSLSSLQLSDHLDSEYQTAWVMAQKIRSTLEEHNWDVMFSGECQMDGVYVNHYVRPANKIENRVDRRKVYKPNKRVIISLRQLPNTQEKGLGAEKTKVFILKSENAKEIDKIANKHIRQKSVIHTDENIAYDNLQGPYTSKRVFHKVEYMGDNGENNNQCESFNARLRRAFKGQFHKASTLYLSLYANEIAYREDTRRISSKDRFYDLLFRCLKSAPSGELTGYWQGNRRLTERLGA